MPSLLLLLRELLLGQLLPVFPVVLKLLEFPLGIIITTNITMITFIAMIAKVSVSTMITIESVPTTIAPIAAITS